MAEYDLTSVLSYTSGFTSVVVYMFIAALVIGIVVGIWYIFSFKVKVRVRQMAKDGRSLVVDDKARKFKDKDGVYWYRLLKHWQVVLAPPDAAIEIDKKGKIVVECSRDKDGSILWGTFNFDPELYKHDHPEYKPLTGEERSATIRQIRAAQEYTRGLWGERLWQMSGLLVVVMILVLFMVFFNEAVAPTKELAQSIAGASDSLSSAVGKMEQICLERPLLEGGVNEPPN